MCKLGYFDLNGIFECSGVESDPTERQIDQSLH